MAELPDLGKNCHLTTCKKLDFTPFGCRLCNFFYCSDHRLNHGCDDSKQFDPSSATSLPTTRPYCCSFEGCSTSESVKISCDACDRNFCLKHRFPSDHSCSHDSEAERRKRQQEISNNIEAIRTAVGVQSTSQTCNEAKKESGEKKKLSPAEQAKMDKVAVMRIKMKNDSGLGANEAMIIFVEYEDTRQPFVMGKKWMIGRCLSTICTSLKVDATTHKLFLPSEKTPLDSSAYCEAVLNAMDTVELRLQ